ncbi:hypothetical protein M378DRAFT_162292 [Amanita muscaria Koide BX008]|uniref:Uncharacterized protein n=1 Tax=Amanita muscaria (strain Koide BX008) TaxID=946122 RepID=A0A0C2X7R2_AMAMK|nr:hypothetical protein M378DRAFT_162292 [Amanita muscaria Koide BX008]
MSYWQSNIPYWASANYVPAAVISSLLTFNLFQHTTSSALLTRDPRAKRRGAVAERLAFRMPTSQLAYTRTIAQRKATDGIQY